MVNSHAVVGHSYETIRIADAEQFLPFQCSHPVFFVHDPKPCCLSVAALHRLFDFPSEALVHARWRDVRSLERFTTSPYSGSACRWWSPVRGRHSSTTTNARKGTVPTDSHHGPDVPQFNRPADPGHARPSCHEPPGPPGHRGVAKASGQ